MPSLGEQLKELKFTITRKLTCSKCNNAWICAMNIHPTGSVCLENTTVQTLLEKSLQASRSDLFNNISARNLVADPGLLSKTVKSCPERVKIECQLPGEFQCPACAPPGQPGQSAHPGHLEDIRPSNMSTGSSNYSLSFHNIEYGTSRQGRATASVHVLISQASVSSNVSSRPLPPLPLSERRERRCSIMDHIFSHKVTKPQICKVLASKERGCYAIVELEIKDGGDEFLRTPYIILCLQLTNEYKVVFQAKNGEIFIHKEERFESLKSLLEYYHTHPTKCGAKFSKQLTKKDLASLTPL